MQSDRRKNDFLDPFLGTFYWLLKKPPSLYQNAKRVLCNPESSREPVFKSFSCFICQLFTGIRSHLVSSVSCLPAYGRILFQLSVVYRYMVASTNASTGRFRHQQEETAFPYSKVMRLFWSRYIKGIFFKIVSHFRV